MPRKAATTKDTTSTEPSVLMEITEEKQLVQRKRNLQKQT